MRLFLALVLALTLGVATSASADTISYPNIGTEATPGAFTAVDTGTITAYFYGSDAAYTSLLSMSVNGTQVATSVLNNHNASYGQSLFDVNVNAGDTITFTLSVLDTGNVWSSDLNLNSDLFNHIYTTDFFGADGLNVQGTYIGFEDLFGGGDKDYNDAQFVLTNVVDPVPGPAPNPVPEPSSLMLLGSGMAGLAGIIRRKMTR